MVPHLPMVLGPARKLATVNVAECHNIFALAPTVSHIGNTTGPMWAMFSLLFAEGPGLTDRESRKNKSTRTGGDCGCEEVSSLHGIFIVRV